MTAPWEVRQDPRDPNAWDVYQGSAKIAHLPWQSKANAGYMARAFNCHEELVAALRDLREATTEAYKHGRVAAEPFVRAGNVLAKAAAEGTK